MFCKNIGEGYMNGEKYVFCRELTSGRQDDNAVSQKIEKHVL